MASHAEPRLRAALERLAADAETQEAYLRRLGTWPLLDELALEIDDVADASMATAMPAARDCVLALSRRLAQMSGEQNARYWQPQALHEPEWDEVRKLAAEALAALPPQPTARG